MGTSIISRKEVSPGALPEASVKFPRRPPRWLPRRPLHKLPEIISIPNAFPFNNTKQLFSNSCHNAFNNPWINCFHAVSSATGVCEKKTPIAIQCEQSKRPTPPPKINVGNEEARSVQHKWAFIYLGWAALLGPQ